jgi:acyl-CoA reductase-like NAD-dependent aldehyde dehydrogenase
MEQFHLVIDGAKVATKEHFEVLNPSSGAVVGRAPVATADDLDRAISAGGPRSPNGRNCPTPSGARSAMPPARRSANTPRNWPGF